MDRRLKGQDARRDPRPVPPERAHNALHLGGEEAGERTTRQGAAWFVIRGGTCGTAVANNMVTRVTGSAFTRQRTASPAVTRMRLIAAPRHGDAPLTRNMEILNQ